MGSKRLIAIAVAAALALPLLVSGGAAATAEQQDRDGWFRQPRTVGTDDAGDWNNGEGAEIGHFLGQDLVEAQIGMQDRRTINFIIKVTFLPPWGGVPEITRYQWEFAVGRKLVQIDGKWTNFSRGACDPTSGQCPPPRNPGVAPFLVRGNCVTEDNLTLCEELGLVEAEFDPAEGTINVPVPLKMIGARRRSVIRPQMSQFNQQVGGEVIAVPSAFFSLSNAPSDALRVTRNYRIPRRARP
jgi:hypothetical protein